MPSLPLLKDVRVASPCPADWDAMEGDDRRRFCHQCEKHVYNFAAMTEPEIVALLSNERVCGRLYRRADGTILTADCPTGVRLARQRLVTLSLRAAAFTLTIFGATLAAVANMGRDGEDRFAQSTTGTALQKWIGRLAPPIAVGGLVVMGDIKAPMPVPPATPATCPN